MASLYPLIPSIYPLMVSLSNHNPHQTVHPVGAFRETPRRGTPPIRWASFDKLRMSGFCSGRRLCPYPVTPSGYSPHLLASPPGRGGFITRPAFNVKHRPVNRWTIAEADPFLRLPSPEQGRVTNPPLPSEGAKTGYKPTPTIHRNRAGKVHSPPFQENSPSHKRS